MYDAIIIGARCAGSPAAMLLAQKGHKVLLLDRDTFPSDTISTHIIFPKGVTQLTKWGVIDKILASNVSFARGVNFDVGPFVLSGKPAALPNGISDVLCPRRTVLDKILVDAAVDAGAELRENCSVTEILMDGNRVTGVRCRTKDGHEFTEKARIVIGADGRNSIVARSVKAEEYNAIPKKTCWYYTYWSNVPIKSLSLYARPNRAIGVIPTNDDMVCIPVTWPIDEFVTYRSDIEGNYMKTLNMIDDLAEHMRQAHREAGFMGMADLPNFFRKSYGPGWALVGDAAYHKDPLSGQGISDALVYTETLAEAVDAGLSGEQPMEEALARYQDQRDAEVMPAYYFTCDFANLAPPTPEMISLFTALYGNRQETDRFIGCLAGTVPIPEFFAPDNLGRIIMQGQTV